MPDKIRVGVFGGARGHAMIDVLFHHPHAELVAVCDKYPAFAGYSSERSGFPPNQRTAI